MKILIINDMIQINNELRDRAYQCACEHGFHDKEYSDAHWMMLIVTEISEAVNADRKGKHADILKFKREFSVNKYFTSEPIRFKNAFEKCIKDSVEDELADVIIRCLDLSGLKNIDIDLGEDECKDNGSSFADKMYWACWALYCDDFSLSEKIEEILIDILQVTSCYKIDLLWFVEQKMRYNESRPMLNGKKY